jgi:hypothetical protein
MLSSWQISQMHQQQAQAFGAQQQYSHQISSMMPPPYQGLGATQWGGGFGQGPGFGYNYGQAASTSYAPGNAFGNAAANFVGGAMGAMGRGAGVAGGVGGFMMGGLRGGMMGFGIGSAVGGAIQAVGGSFMEGAHEQQAVERTLGQFQFQNANSRTGKGFSRNDAMQVGSMMRQIEDMPQMLTSFGELNRLMDKMGQMGLMNGLRDAGEFMKKFRDTVHVLKDLSKVMGTTMEGALQAFGESRMSGFYGQADIVKNVMNRQLTSSLTGMNQSQVGALQQFGSQLGHQMGGSRKTGAQFATRTAAQLGMANQLGILSNDQIMEMTGKEGAEGIQDLSASMTQLGYKMGYSNVGQAMTLALGKTEGGRYTGEMDQELVDRVRRGEIGINELKSLARKKSGTRGAKLSFAAHKERLRSEMVGAVGTEGIGMQLQELLGERGWNNPDATNLVMQRFGASEEQANLMQQMMPNLQNIGSQINLAGKNASKQGALNAAMRENSWDAIKHRIGKKLEDATLGWAKDLGRYTRESFQDFADTFMDDLTGQYKEHVTNRLAKAVRYSMAGSSSNSAMLGGRSDAAFAISGMGASRMDVGAASRKYGGAFKLSSELGARALHFMSGKQSAGEQAADFLGGFNKGAYLEQGQVSDIEKQAKMGGENVAILDSAYWTRSGTGITANNARRVQEHAQNITGEGGMTQWEKALRIGGAGSETSLRSAFQQAMQSAEVQLEVDPAKKAQMVWKQMRGKIAPEVLAKLEKSSMGQNEIMAGVQAAEKQKGNVYAGNVDFGAAARGALGNIDFGNQTAISHKIDELNKDLGKNLPGSDTQASWADLKKMADDGSQMSLLLMGDSKHRGLLGSGNMFKNMATAGDMRVRSLAAKSPKDWSPEDIKVLKEMGVDVDKLAAEINKDPEAWKKLQGAAQSGKISLENFASYIALTDRSGLNKIAKDLKGQGSELALRLSQNTDAKAKLLAGGQGALISQLETLSKNLVGVEGDTVQSFKDTTGDIAARISGIKDSSLREQALQLAGAEVRTAYGMRQGLAGRIGGKKLDDVLGMANIKLGSSQEDVAFQKDLQSQFTGKGGTLDSKNMDKVLNMLTNYQSGLSRVTAGASANSTQVSEADVANTLKSLSDNNVKMATILGNIAAGKSGDKLLEGYATPAKQ